MRVRWLRLVPGILLVVVPLWVAATTWSVLVANHPAYPVTLAIALVVGVVLVVTGLTAPDPPRPGWWRWLLRGLGAVVGVAAALALAWLRPFPAAPEALDALAGGPGVTVTEDRTAVRFSPAESTGAGLVLYPGARVDPQAYAVLARAIGEQGHPVVILKCPFDIAFTCAGRGPTEATAAGGAWALGGHSLGGVVAASDAGGDGSPVGGLLLWASYPVGDLSGRDDLAVASVSGSEDGLTTPADVAASRDLLPPDTTFVEVPGATHAYFGDYGDQPGDGTATVPRDVAQAQIVDASVALLGSVG